MPLVRKNGQMVNVSEEEAKQLREAAGLPPPVDPASTAAEGANPDQAKMAGTPNQTKTATNVALTGTKTLAGTERLDQGRTQASDTEKAAMEKANRLAQVGSLGTRVEGLIAKQMAAGAAAATGKATIDTAQLAGLKLDPASQAKATELLNKVAAGDRSTATIDALNALGVTSPDALIQTGSQAIGKQLAGAVLNSDAVTVDMLGLSQQEMTDLLGPNWKNMSLEQLQTQVATMQQQEFGRADDIRARLADPFTSPAEKERLRKELVGMGQVGVENAEQLVDTLSTNIEGATDDIKAALEDEAISAEIMEYLDDPENSDLASKNPALAQWAESQREALSAIAGEVKASVDQNKLIIEANSKLAEQIGEGNDTLVKLLGLDKGGKKVKFPLMSVIQGRDNAPDVFTKLNDLAELDPDVIGEFAKIPPAEFEKMLASGQFDRYVQAKTQIRDIKNVDKMNLDQLADFVFGSDVDIKSVQQSYQQDLALAKQGDPMATKRAARISRLFDNNKDGILDDPSQVRGRVKDKFRSPSVGGIKEQARPHDFGVGAVGQGQAMQQVYGALKLPEGSSPGGVLNKLNAMSASATAGGKPNIVAKQQAAVSQAYTPEQVRAAASAQLPMGPQHLAALKSGLGQLKELLNTELPPEQKKIVQQQMANIQKGLDTARQFYIVQQGLLAKMEAPMGREYFEKTKPSTPSGTPWDQLKPAQKDFMVRTMAKERQKQAKELRAKLAALGEVVN